MLIRITGSWISFTEFGGEGVGVGDIACVKKSSILVAITPGETLVENLKIKVRKLSDQDIKTRNLPNQTNGLVITSIEKDSPLNGSIEVNSIILEAQKKKIRSVEDLNQSLKQVLNSNQKTILLVIYNSQNQKRYIGVKLD